MKKWMKPAQHMLEGNVQNLGTLGIRKTHALITQYSSQMEFNTSVFPGTGPVQAT